MLLGNATGYLGITLNGSGMTSNDTGMRNGVAGMSLNVTRTRLIVTGMRQRFAGITCNSTGMTLKFDGDGSGTRKVGCILVKMTCQEMAFRLVELKKRLLTHIYEIYFYLSLLCFYNGAFLCPNLSIFRRGYSSFRLEKFRHQPIDH